jgi:thymidylate synthase
MILFKNLIREVIKNGVEVKNDRTGTGMMVGPPSQYQFDLGLNQDGSYKLPLVTVKKTNFKAILAEFLWFISGSTNVNNLPEKYQFMWKPWADETGNIGPLYGLQWKMQLQNVIDNINNDPLSRAHVMTNWNPDSHIYAYNGYRDSKYLVPCHGVYVQFHAFADGLLSIQVTHRSTDVLIGGPYNIVTYALLLYLVCHATNRRPNMMYMNFSTPHIYLNQLEYVPEILNRFPLSMPSLKIQHRNNIKHYSMEDFNVLNYNHHGKMNIPVSI